MQAENISAGLDKALSGCWQSRLKSRANPNRKATTTMLDAIKGRRERDDEGFTLIELMVVLLIIAILMAIAIPTFLGARNTANARATQSNLRNALTAEQTYWTNNQAFTASTTALGGIESSLGWSTSEATAEGGNTVTVTTSSAGQLVELQAYAKDGNCYAIQQDNNPSNSFTGYSETKGACTTPGTLDSSTAPAPSSGSAAQNIGSKTFYTSF